MATDGALWLLEPDYSAHGVLSGITVPNGLCFSPRRLHHLLHRQPDAADHGLRLRLRTGTPSCPRLFAKVPDKAGCPDGAIVDAEGEWWSCEWHSARVVRYAPDGTVDRVVAMPVPCPMAAVLGVITLAIWAWVIVGWVVRAWRGRDIVGRLQMLQRFAQSCRSRKQDGGRRTDPSA